MDFANALGTVSRKGQQELFRSIFGSIQQQVTSGVPDVELGQPMRVFTVIEPGLIDSRIAFSADGEHLAAGVDYNVHIYNVRTGALVRELVGHTLEVVSVAYSRNGEFLASGSADQSVKIWRTHDGTLLKTLRAHRDTVRNVVFSPNSQLLASSSYNGHVAVWSVQSGHTVEEFGSGAVVAFAPIGETISFATTRYISSYSLVLSEFVLTIPNVFEADSLAYSPDGVFVVAAVGLNIAVYNLSTRILTRTLRGHTEVVNTAVFSPIGNRIVSGSDDGTVRIWSASTGALLHTEQVGQVVIRSVVFSPNGQLIAASESGVAIHVWRTPNVVAVRTWSDRLNAVSFSPDGKLIAAPSSFGSILIATVGGEFVRRISASLDSEVESIAFSPDGQLLASAAGGTTIELWRVDGGQRVRTLSTVIESAITVEFSPSGHFLASASYAGDVKLFRVRDGRLVLTLRGHLRTVTSVAFSPNGQLIASGSLDNTVKLWRIDGLGEVRTFLDHMDRVNHVAFSPNGQLLASTSHDATIRLWTVDNGVLVRTLRGHGRNAVESAVFSPNGQLLASASLDRTVKLWRTDRWEVVRTLHGHTNWVRSVAFSPNGQLLASASADRTVKIWPIVYDYPEALPPPDEQQPAEPQPDDVQVEPVQPQQPDDVQVEPVQPQQPDDVQVAPASNLSQLLSGTISFQEYMERVEQSSDVIFSALFAAIVAPRLQHDAVPEILVYIINQDASPFDDVVEGPDVTWVGRLMRLRRLVGTRARIRQMQSNIDMAKTLQRAIDEFVVARQDVLGNCSNDQDPISLEELATLNPNDIVKIFVDRPQQRQELLFMCYERSGLLAALANDIRGNFTKLPTRELMPRSAMQIVESYSRIFAVQDVRATANLGEPVYMLTPVPQTLTDLLRRGIKRDR